MKKRLIFLVYSFLVGTLYCAEAARVGVSKKLIVPLKSRKISPISALPFKARPQSAPAGAPKEATVFGSFRVISPKRDTDSGISMESVYPFFPGTPPKFTGLQDSPIGFYTEKIKFLLDKEVFPPDFSEEDKADLSRTLPFLEESEKLLYHVGLYIDPYSDITILLVDLPFKFSPRVQAWFDKPFEQFIDQGYKEGAVPGRISPEEAAEKAKLVKDFGEQIIMTGHSFPRIIDRFIDWGNLMMVGGNVNINLPGSIQRIEKDPKTGEKVIKENRGTYTWTPTTQTKNDQIPEIFHRTFMVGLDYSAKKSTEKQNKAQQALHRFFKNTLSAYDNPKLAREALQVREILINRIDKSVAFVTESGAYVVSPDFEGNLFILYRPKEIKGEKKSYHLPRIFLSHSDQLNFSSEVLWPLPIEIRVPAVDGVKKPKARRKYTRRLSEFLYEQLGKYFKRGAQEPIPDQIPEEEDDDEALSPERLERIAFEEVQQDDAEKVVDDWEDLLSDEE